MAFHIISRALILITALFLTASIGALAQDDLANDVTPNFVIVGDLEIFDNEAAFRGECPFLALEDFEDTNVPPNDSEQCGTSINSSTNNACYSTGALIPGFSIGTTNLGQITVLTPPLVALTNVAVGPSLPDDDMEITFTEFVNAVGMELVTAIGSTPVRIDVFGVGDVLLGSTIKVVTPGNGIFVGIISQEQIIRIGMEDFDDDAEFLYSLSFGTCKQCQVSVVKSATPADDTLFDFSVDGVLDFSLSDPSDTEEVVLFDPGDTITVTEQLPLGWQLDEVVCDSPTGGIESTSIDGGVSLECSFTSTATCTFFNGPAPRPIPTLSEWGLIAMAGVIGVIGLLALRRRRATA